VRPSTLLSLRAVTGRPRIIKRRRRRFLQEAPHAHTSEQDMGRNGRPAYVGRRQTAGPIC
jgi:hypothetical protein